MGRLYLPHIHVGIIECIDSSSNSLKGGGSMESNTAFLSQTNAKYGDHVNGIEAIHGLIFVLGCLLIC